jgi:hypothetical protein
MPKHTHSMCRLHALMPQVGTRYTLLKVLGAGSFSSVVAALDKDTGEKVCCVCLLVLLLLWGWGGPRGGPRGGGGGA